MSDYRYKVDVEEVRAAITKFNNCKQEMSNAYLQMSAAVTTLNGSWDGAASEAFANKFSDLFKNIQTSDATIDQAVKGLQTAVDVYSETEETNTAILESLSDASAFQG